MNRRQFASLLPSLALGAGCTAITPPVARPIRILSYNLHHGEGVDGKLDLERIARVIRDSRADLVALQEVDVLAQRTGKVDQAAEYRRLTGLQGEFGKAIDLQGGAYGQVLLSRWPLTDFQVELLPNPRNREQRIAVSASVQPPGWPVLRFIGAHLDATRTDEDRWLQAERLLTAFNGSYPAILAGDFNDQPESRVMRRLLESWEDTAAENPQPTIPVENPRDRIDFILVRPRGNWRVVRSEVLPEAVASDHRPLLTEIALR
jgi:endonuclease/exonuclease/phosphatase family metal-dependent hydrolase